MLCLTFRLPASSETENEQACSFSVSDEAGRQTQSERRRKPLSKRIYKAGLIFGVPAVNVPEQRQVQHCGRLVQQSRIDHDGCHTEGRGVQEGHTGAPRERLPFSLRC